MAQKMTSKKVPCEFEGCDARIPIEDFDEEIWLPVFKASRHHMGFFCPGHVAQVRAGELKERYILTQTDQDELIIDLKPLPPKGE